MGIVIKQLNTEGIKHSISVNETMQDSYLLTTYRLEGLDLFKQFKLRKQL